MGFVTMTQINAASPSEVEDIDLGGDAYRQNWFEISARWATRSPFYFREGKSVGVICARHADVRTVFDDPERFSIVNRRAEFRRLAPYRGLKTLSSTEGIEHSRQRRIMMPPFSLKSIAHLDEQAAPIIEELLDRIEDRGPGATFDARTDFAAPLMERLLLDAMFRLNSDQKRAFSEMNESRASLARLKPCESVSDDFSQKFDAARTALEDVIAQRSVTPGDDFISQLLAAEDENRKLTHEQVLGGLFGMSSATTGSTPASIAFALMNLCRNPDQLTTLRENPSLAPEAMDECLRYHPPVYVTFPRFATCDTAIAGTEIAEGTLIQLSLSSANFDPVQFPDPLRFDVRRAPKGIMSFGTGTHVCIASRLARTMMQSAVMAILSRFPKLTLANPSFQPVYSGTVGELIPNAMPMTA